MKRCQGAGPTVPPEGCPNQPTARVFFPGADKSTAVVCTDCRLNLDQLVRENFHQELAWEPLP